VLAPDAPAAAQLAGGDRLILVSARGRPAGSSPA
jgi:hypothetical protein